MEINNIINHESANNGNQIHLYYVEKIGMWCAYGYSAYSLRLFDKSNGYNSLRGYSKSLQMPCTITSNESIEPLLKSAIEIPLQTDTYISLRMHDIINTDAYNKWAHKLNGGINNDDEIIVITPVSQYVPKDRFIPDGMSAFARNVKRAFDFFLSLIALVLFSPLFLICYIAIRREDGGPAIFKQKRIGRYGRPFYIYKFRSMRLDAEKFGPQLSHSGGENDPRLTKIGRFIRAHHLDELPQLYNVLRGDMAFIGPRPERKFYIDQIIEHDPRYTYLYQIRPGITSYATLYNGYTDTMEKMLRRLEYDLYYLGHRSCLFDFKILLNTFCSIVFGKKF